MLYLSVWGDNMEKTSTNNKSLVEEANDKFKEHQSKQQKLLWEERNSKREETYKKFQNMKEILNENIHIQGLIRNIIDELKFSNRDITKTGYSYYVFCIVTIILLAAILWKLNVMNLNVKLFFIPVILAFILINYIVFYAISYITQRKIYEKYINNCKDAHIDNGDILQLISILLDNNLRISHTLPRDFFNYFIKEYHKTKYDICIDFLYKNTKSLSQKYKSANLRFYKGIYTRNMEILLDIEEMQNNYFESKFSGPIVDTIEECTKKLLHNK